MKRLNNTLLLFFVLIGLITCDTDSNTPADFRNYFIKYYGASGNQQGVDIVVNADGTMLLLGNSQEFEDDSHFFVVKIDSIGQILWENSYGLRNGSNEFAVDIEPTIDGNYVIAAQKQISATDVDVLLTKIPPDVSSGNPEFGEGGFIGKLDSVKSITPLSDGSYLMTGSTNKTKVDAEIEAFVFKCDADLNFENVIWIDTYGSGIINQGIKIFENTPQEYSLFLTSNQELLAGNDYNFLYIPLNKDAASLKGTILPSDFADSNNERLSSVASIPSTNGFAMLGTSESASNKTVYTLITGSTPDPSNIINSGSEKLNLSANSIENYTGKSIYSSKFGGFFVLADREVTIGNSLIKTIVLIRLDAQGRVLWSNNFGSVFSTKGTALAELPNGKVVIVGTATLDNQEKIILIKVNLEGHFLN
jgi:hypothetical protein